ncbi:hypothetical protein AX16_009548 [Volvariella volvacea WC 439]|nr:hypothetical protein AX16_009548 [Volvariella volvacea WC 439]
MLGLQELFQANPGLFQLKLTALLNACARLISDDDAGIRRSLLAFLNWSLPLVRQEDLLPHAHTLLLYTTSAQTHIFPEIRLDAIRILDTLLDYIPTAVVEGWAGSGNAHGGRILRGYLNMLNAGTAADRSIATPTTAVVLSPQSRSIVLRSLSKFLHQCLAQHGLGSQLNVSPTGCVDPLYMKYFFATSDAYHTFSQFLKPRFNTPQTYWADDLEFGQCTFPPNLISLVSPTGQWPLTQLMDIGDDGDDEAVRQSIDHSFLQVSEPDKEWQRVLKAHRTSSTL